MIENQDYMVDCSDTSIKPVVSFVLYAFNEERFIREAVASALAQTYSPLEIVLSDDGSTDNTFKIMQEMAAGYQGPHKIILNRNEKNIGIGSQLNAAYQKSRGELILLANGDDISLPERTTRTVEAWLASDRRAQAITTDLATMDKEGKRLPRVLTQDKLYRNLEDGVRKRFGGVGAASLAITRKVFSDFGPLQPNLILEDGPLFMRATLLGKRIHLRESYVVYRIHKNNVSQAYCLDDFHVWVKRHHEKILWNHSEGVKAYLQMLNDLHTITMQNWPEKDLKRAHWAAVEKMIEQDILLDHYSSAKTLSFSDRWRALTRLAFLLIKLVIKKRIPAIERRNDRWHHKRIG